MSEQFRVKCKELFAEAKVIKEEVGCHPVKSFKGRHVESLKKLDEL